MKTLYPQTKDYLHYVIRQGRSLLSDLTPEERRLLTIHYLDEFKDTEEALLLSMPDKSSKLLSNFICGFAIEKKELKSKLLQGVFDGNRIQMEKLFEESLWNYRWDHVNTIVSERTNFTTQDNRDRYRNIA